MNNYKTVFAAILMMFLSTACSKKLMPPEIGSSSASEGLESSDFTASNPPQDEGTLGGSGGSGSGSFSEEAILESGASAGGSFDGSGGGKMADNSSGGLGGSSMNNFGSSGKGSIGNGSSGSFESSNPFLGSGGNGGTGSRNGSGSGDQVANLKNNFLETEELKDIHFKFDKYDLDSDSKKVLQQNAEFLKKNPSMTIEIQGHCDERGTNNYNTALGERRANSTKKFLVSLGINASRLNTISYGEEKPFCFDSNENCWFQNRRAHFMMAK